MKWWKSWQRVRCIGSHRERVTMETDNTGGRPCCPCCCQPGTEAGITSRRSCVLFHHLLNYEVPCYCIKTMSSLELHRNKPSGSYLFLIHMRGAGTRFKSRSGAKCSVDSQNWLTDKHCLQWAPRCHEGGGRSPYAYSLLYIHNACSVPRENKILQFTRKRSHIDQIIYQRPMFVNVCICWL